MPVDWRNFLSFPQERASGATRPAPAARGPGQLGRACRALTLAALLLPAWASIFSGHASAQTSIADSPQAGIILRTQADVTLLPAGHTREVRILSNIVEVRVSPVEALLLTPGGSRDGVPGASVQMPHVLTNTGNIVSGYAFDLNVVAGSFAPQAPYIVHDRNDNGVEDDGDARIPLQGPAFTLEPGEAASLLAIATVPDDAQDGQAAVLRLSARSQARSVLTSKNDVIVVREGAAFALHKTADADRAQGGDVVGYTLDATNNGNADAEGTETGKDLDGATGALRIDGVAARAVLLRDRIPAHTRLVSGSLQTAIAGARRLWHAPGDAPFSYRSSEVANADEVAIALPVVQRNQSLRMGFSVRVDDDHAGRVDNVGVLNFHAAASPDGVRMQPSNTVPVMVDGTEGVDLTLVKTHDGNFHAGLEQAYTLKVHAANQPSAGAISVVDTLPDGMQLVSAKGPLWTCDAAGQTVSCQTSQTIGPDSPSAPLTLVARVPATVLAGQSAVTLINRAAVSGGGEPAAFAGNNSVEDPTVIEAGAKLSGKVWLDLNRDRLHQGGERPLAGWRAQLLLPYNDPAARTAGLRSVVIGPGTQYRLVQEAVTDAAGAYRMQDVTPRADYALRFLSPSGYQYATPVDGDNGAAQSGARPDTDAGMLVDLSIAANADITGQSLPVIPSGVVYGSSNRQPLAGAMVRLSGPVGFDPARHLVGGAGNAEQRSSDEGMYQFLLTSDAPSGRYQLLTRPSAGYVSPSTALPPQPQALVLPTGAAPLAVQPQAAPPQPGEATTYYTQFTVSSGSRPVANNHLPLDQAATQGLLLRKSASKSVVETVDFVDYALELNNQTGGLLAGATFEDLPAAGFVYQQGSARVITAAGASAVEPLLTPNGKGGLSMRFELPSLRLADQEALRLTYRMRVNVGALQGDGVNRARATSGALRSNEASARVKVVGGVFAEEAFVIGKVTLDCNRNGIQDEEAGEIGIPGVRLYLEDGTFAITDSEGKYSFYGLRPLTHVLKLDLTTLPQGAVLGSAGHRNSVDEQASPAVRTRQASTRFVDLKKGELHKANFVEQSCAPSVRRDVIARRDAASAQRDEAASSVRRDFKAQAQLVETTDVRSRPQTGYMDPERGTPGADQPPGRDGKSPAPRATRTEAANAAGAPDAATARPLEELLPEADPELGLLNLKEGQTLPIAQTSIMVKGRLGAIFRLKVNGAEVGQDRVGKKSQLQDQGVQGWEYVGVNLRPGVNRIQVEQLDGMGNARGSASVSVIAPGRLARIELSAPDRPMADGRTPARLRLRLMDRDGVPFAARTQVTLNATIGQWQLEDLSPAEPGTQIFVEGGQAELPLTPPASPGEGHVEVQAGNLRKKIPLAFVPELRPMIAAGIVEGSISLNQIDFSKMEPVRSGDVFERELRAHSRSFNDGKGSAGGRAAFFLKGKIRGDYLLTAAYDSEKTTRDRLFRDIQPDEYYPIYGDSAQRGFDAQSTGRLYVRIDKDKSYLLYGDYTTASSDTVRQISQYSRSLNGVKGHYETDIQGRKVEVTGFAAHDTLRQMVEEFAANGTSGPFQLRHGDLYLNSEQVVVLTRDRNQPSLILRSETRQRFVDYELEPWTGRLLFKAPIPSFDADLNPNSIRVSYEVDSGGEAFAVYGADAQVQATEKLRVGGVYVRDEDPGKSFGMRAVTGEYKFGERTTLSAELASTRNGDSSLLDSQLTGQPGGQGETPAVAPGADLLGEHSGSARRVEFRHEGTDLNVLAQYASADEGFDNISAPVSQGRTEIAGKAEYRIDEHTALRGEIRSSEDERYGSKREGATVSVERRLSETVVAEAGMRRYAETVADNGYMAEQGVAPYSGTTLRGKLSVQWPTNPNAVGYLEYEQDVSESDRRVAAVGGEYRLGSGGRVYGRYEFLSSLGSLYSLNDTQRRYTGLFGFDTQYMKDGSVFSEYRMNDAMDGRSAQAAVGLRNLWSVTDSWRLGTTFESTRPLFSPERGDTGGYGGAFSMPGDYASLNESSVAGTVAAEYVGSERMKFSTRLEARRATSLDSYLHTAAVAYKLSPDWTLLLRNDVQLDKGRDGNAGDATRLRQQIGAAYRPVDNDRFNFLTRYEHRAERLSGAASSYLAGSASGLDSQFLANGLRQDTHILSAHANWQPISKLTLSGRYAFKWTTDESNGLSSKNWAHLVYGRAMWDLARRWDAGVQAFAMTGKGGARQTGFGVEAGYMVTPDVWVSVGYNFSGFRETDLAGDAQTNRGVFLRLRMKFDESLFDGAGQ